MDRVLPAHAAALPGVLGAIYDLAVGAPGKGRCRFRQYPARAWPRLELVFDRGVVTLYG